MVFVPGATPSHQTEPVDESVDYVFMDPPAPPQGKKQPLHPGSPPQPLAVVGQNQKYSKSGVARLGHHPVMQAGKQHSQHPTSSDWQKHSSLQDKSQGIDD